MEKDERRQIGILWIKFVFLRGIAVGSLITLIFVLVDLIKDLIFQTQSVSLELWQNTSKWTNIDVFLDYWLFHVLLGMVICSGWAFFQKLNLRQR